MKMMRMKKIKLKKEKKKSRQFKPKIALWSSTLALLFT